MDGPGSFKNISQQVHTVTKAVERTVSRSAIEYGATIAVCENQSEWSQVGAARVGETFEANGETFQNMGVISEPMDVDMSEFVNPAWDMDQILATTRHWNNGPGHSSSALDLCRPVLDGNYWDYVTETFGVNGSVYGRLF